MNSSLAAPLLAASLGMGVALQPSAWALQSGSGGGSGSSGSGGGGDIPTGGRPSPLFGAQPFTQRLLLFEEFGTESMPSSFTAGRPLPQPRDASSIPDSADLDAFLRQSLFPAPERMANDTLENPWSSRIEALLGREL